MISGTMQKNNGILLTLLVFLVTGFSVFAQGDWTDKISWSFKLEKIDDNHAFVVGTAKLKEGWHIFSVNHDPNKADFTGFPTKFTFEKSTNYKLIGSLVDGIKPETVKDELGISLYFEHKAVFKQKIEVLNDKPFDLKFDYAFQICDVNGCIFPPDQSAKLKVSGFTGGGKTDEVEEVIETAQQVDVVAGAVKKDSAVAKDTQKPIKTMKKPVIAEAKKSLFMIFLEGFGWGFVALLTPCVFPMIPMTVSFFTKRSGSRSKGIKNALIYGLSIVVIYVSLGILITVLTKSPTALNELSTNVYMNLLFFIVFMVFAFSFLGAFEIQLPTSWVNKADSQADKGGLIGIFFMAFTLALVSFSCTGPIIGSSLVQAVASGSVMGPAVIMFGFSTALSLPFMLFAIFPSLMNSIPQSGGWLNSVKVVLGLIEIALALKFLSMVDLAYHWNILTRELFVAMWVVIFVVMGLYLLGKIHFSHDSPVDSVSVPRFLFAFIALSFAVYLFPGMFGAPLSMIEGVAPPRTYSEDNFRFVKGNGDGDMTASADPVFEAYRQYMHAVGDGSILVFHDLEKGREYAKKVNKPVLVDFTGFACANCRKTESIVWTNDEIRPVLQKDMVIVSLYCDDRAALPKSAWKYSDNIKGMIKNVGNKWSDYQIGKYGQVSQPLYIVQDLEGNDLTEAIGYTPDIEAYKAFLQKGINAFKASKK